MEATTITATRTATIGGDFGCGSIYTLTDPYGETIEIDVPAGELLADRVEALGLGPINLVVTR